MKINKDVLTSNPSAGYHTSVMIHRHGWIVALACGCSMSSPVALHPVEPVPVACPSVDETRLTDVLAYQDRKPDAVHCACDACLALFRSDTSDETNKTYFRTLAQTLASESSEGFEAIMFSGSRVNERGVAEFYIVGAVSPGLAVESAVMNLWHRFRFPSR